MHVSYSYSAIIRELGLETVLDELRATAAERDLNGTHAFEAVGKLKAGRFTIMRLPRQMGGCAASYPDYLAAIYDLAVADPSIAHAFINHFSNADAAAAAAPDHPLARHVLPKILQRKTFSASTGFTIVDAKGARAQSERALPDSPRLTRSGDGYRLTGRAVYSTGNLYADYLNVAALDEEGRVNRVLVPTDRQGLTILDDWDGFGQRGSGSGTTVFEDIRIDPEDILIIVPARAPTQKPYHYTPSQLYLTAVVAAATQAALIDAAGYLRGRRSNSYFGQQDRAVDEASVQLVIGEISADAYAMRATLLAAGATLETAVTLAATGTASAEEVLEARRQASLEAVRAKVFIDGLAQRATSRIFDTFGGSGTSRKLALDRHWRSARTVAAQNSTLYKTRLLGDHALNGVPLPSSLYF